MKALVIAGVATLLLSACASDGQFRTSSSLSGSFQSMDMRDPHFYMDDDAGPSAASPARGPTAPRYGIDSYCGYCGRAY